MYVTVYRPYLSDRDNYLEIFNETTICILFVIPMCALIVDETLLDGPGRHNLGYVLIGILILNLAINYLMLILDIIKILWANPESLLMRQLSLK